jgi:hypothetical protein
MSEDILTPAELARCEAMKDAADGHAAIVQERVDWLLRRQRESASVREVVEALVVIDLHWRSRCAALDVTPGPLEDTLDRLGVWTQARGAVIRKLTQEVQGTQ